MPHRSHTFARASAYGRALAAALLLLAGKASAHQCGPATLDMTQGDHRIWRITADLTEFVSQYTIHLLPNPAVVQIDWPDEPANPFFEHHGAFDVHAVGPGSTDMLVEWFYADTGAGGFCFVTFNVTAAPLFGACTLPDGGCVDGMTRTDCTTTGGTYEGNGSSCYDLLDPEITISQVAFTYKGVTVVPFSEWGQFDLEINPLPVISFMNVVLDPDTPGEAWAVQNHPILTAVHSSFSNKTTQFFNLNIPRGQDNTDTIRTLRLTIHNAPQPIVPDAGPKVQFTIQLSHDIVNDGGPTDIIVLNPPPVLDDFFPSVEDPSIIRHENMPNVLQDQNFCGPGAAANSLHWLAQEHGYTLGQTPRETQAELAATMGNTNDGNQDHEQVQGILAYIDDHSLPLEVHYTGGFILPTDGDYVDPNGNGTARSDGPISAEWLKQQMQMGQDVGLMTLTHWVVMEAILCHDDEVYILYRDDPWQEGVQGSAPHQQIVADRHVWTMFDTVTHTLNIGNGKETLITATAVSPLPVPNSPDINHDGSVNVNDLLLMVGAWGPCPMPPPPPSNCPADLNSDGSVNVNDLLILIGAWG